LREALIGETAVGGVTGLFQRPTQFGSRYSGADWEGRDPGANPGIYYCGVDYDYVQTMKIQILAGRPFDRKYPSDAADTHLVNMSIGRQVPGEESTNAANAFLINEELARWMGGTSAVGKRFDFLGSRGVVVGVMKNFHFQSLQKSIEPLALFASPRKVRYAVVRLAGGDLGAALDKVKAAWKSVFPQAPFDYRFYDDDFGRMLVSETRMKTLLQGGAGLAVFIAGLGLFGLASFMTEQRRREIGIRKVMGASAPGILFLLTREFVKWVVLANLIAAPAAYLLSAGWLKGYAFRIALGWDVFALTLAGTLIVALVTVGRLAFRSARANPVQSIKSE
jgi:ABC-type antimicrobial peptide transport system permease subunit